MNIGSENESIEFKKSISEIREGVISVSAILNKRGEGLLYFGVKNNGDVIGQQIGMDTARDISRKIYEQIKPVPNISVEVLRDNDKEYIKVSFNGKEAPYAADGRYYMRVADEDREMTQAQLRDLFSDMADYSEWENALTTFTADDINENLLIACYGDGLKSGRFSEQYTDKESVLSRLNLLWDGYLTNAGYYLLSKQKPVLLKLALFATDAKITFIDQNHFHGNIVECIEEALIFIKRYMRWRAEFDGGINRKDIPEVPVDAVREIVVNSFAHAKYKGILAAHEIDISPSKIEIYNPGRLPSGVVPEDYLGGQERSILKNPAIAGFLFRSNKIEAFGTGFRKAILLCSENNVKYAYLNNAQGFTFEFIREPLYKDASKSNSAKPKLKGTELAVYEALKNDLTLSAEEIGIQIDKDKRTVLRKYDSLKAKGYIKREGSERNGRWIILE